MQEAFKKASTRESTQELKHMLRQRFEMASNLRDVTGEPPRAKAQLEQRSDVAELREALLEFKQYLLDARKNDLQHAQPSLHPDGSQGPNAKDLTAMRAREDAQHAVTKAEHHLERGSQMRQDFGMSM